MKTNLLPIDRLSQTSRTSVWIVLVAVASVLFSLGLACATPFAALAAIAGSRLSRNNALALVALAWLANQGIGFLALDYPRTMESFGWGIAIGIAAFLATLAVHGLERFALRPLTQFVAGFALAFVVYQVALYAGTAVLPAGAGFTIETIIYVAKVNALGFAMLFALYQLGLAAGLLNAPARTVRA